MNLHIDKENLLSLIESHSHEMYQDCVKLIKKQLNTYFSFSKNEIAENETLTHWFSQNLTQGLSKETKQLFDSTFSSAPLNANSYKSFDEQQLSSIYLKKETEERTFQNGALLVGRIGEEISILTKVFFKPDDYIFEKKWRIGGDDFKRWSDLAGLSLPMTDIIVVDQFVSNDENLIEYNIIEFLKTLCAKPKLKLNIVFYTNRSETIQYNKLSPLVRAAVRSVTGFTPNFTLVTYLKQRGLKSLEEHDRTIVTNYKRIESGDSFNYFDSNGNIITTGREIHYSSLASSENFHLSRLLLKDLQNAIDFLKQQGHGIEGDKKSRFLNF